MITLQTVLSAFLTLLIILLVLTVILPAGLERMSRANRAKRETFIAELTAHHRDADRLDVALQPFSRVQSAAYRQAAAVAYDRSTALSHQLDGLAQSLDGLQCPRIFGYLFPIQHFFIAPDDIGIILSDANRLRQARAQSAAATRLAAETRAAIDVLAALPRQLAADRAILDRRLTGLEAAARRERDAGIIALDDLRRDADRVHTQLERHRQLARQGASVADLDGAALALEVASATLDEAEARAAELTQQRAALDESISRAARDLDNLQAGAKSGRNADDSADKVRPLLLRAAALLNESAPDHRSRREFNPAAADVATATRLIAVAHDLRATGRHTRTLIARDDGSTLHPAIATLRHELSELLDWLGQEAMSDEGISLLAGRSAEMRARAEALTHRQDEAIAELEREAMVTRDQLERSWEAAQRLLPLADDDPLARRRLRLLDDFQAAQRRPAELEKFRGDVAAFEKVLTPWVTRVQATRARIGRLRERMPGIIDAALAAAEPWQCLTESRVFIQQRAADFRTAQSQFAAVRQRRPAESLMEQIEAIEKEVEERAAQLADWANRLNFLEDDARQIIALGQADVAAFPADHPERARWDKALRLIEHNIRTARTAGRYEDAAGALTRAAEVANKVAV